MRRSRFLVQDGYRTDSKCHDSSPMFLFKMSYLIDKVCLDSMLNNISRKYRFVLGNFPSLPSEACFLFFDGLILLSGDVELILGPRDGSTGDDRLDCLESVEEKLIQ